MPNAIKYSTNAQTLALKQGNYWIGTGDVEKGPTSTTDYWNGITPPSGGYTIYLNKASNGPSIYTAANDSALISLTNSIAGASYTTVAQCFNYFRTQTDKMVFNRDYEPIVTNGLVLCLDAGFRPSYTTSGTTWHDISPSGNNATLVSGSTFNSNQGGAIKFDASTGYVTVVDSNSIDFDQSQLTVSLWFNRGTILGPLSGDQQNLIVKGSTTAAGGDQINYSVMLFGPTGGGDIRWANGVLGGGAAIYSPPSQIFFTDTWYNFCYTHVSGNAPLPYVNAVLQTNYTFTAGTATVPFKANAFGLTLAGDDTRTIGSKVALFDGRIAIVQLYNRALTAAEILQNYNAQKARFGL